MQYPSFVRTVPSDRWQATAMVQLLKEFSWNWVAVIGSDDDYGKQGKQQLSSMAVEEGICVAYEGLIPVYGNPVPVIREILEAINETKVGVAVVFSVSQATAAFFKEVRESPVQRNCSLPCGRNIYSSGNILGATSS